MITPLVLEIFHHAVGLERGMIRLENTPLVIHRWGVNVNETGRHLSLIAVNPLLRAIEDLAIRIPHSAEPTSSNPTKRAGKLVTMASLKSGSLSATLAIPPGPAGMLTVVPDLIKVWQIQQQMVADVAACFGKTAELNRQMMVYGLFRHGAAMLLPDVAVRVGERVIVKKASAQVIQRTLRTIGVRLTQQAVGKTLARWLPVVGPLLIGGYSLMDTRKVGKTAINAFSRTIEIEPDASVIDV